MCTVTIIPFKSGLRLAINRDELRTRPAALPPAEFELETGCRAAWPIDTHARGTWVTVNDSGLVLAILNGNPTPMPTLPPKHLLTSRGRIIPSLVIASTADAAIEHLERLTLPRFAPFRVVAADGAGIFDATWDGTRLAIARRPLAPACYVSSGLGDHRAAPRLALFDEWFASRAPTPRAQDEFHQHQWPDRPEISVRMARADARTISITIIESAPSAPILMHYTDDAGLRALTLAGDIASSPVPNGGGVTSLRVTEGASSAARRAAC